MLDEQTISQIKMAEDKSSIISALVSQMKSGQISKNDLFDQLSNLQRGNPPGGEDESDTNGDFDGRVEDNGPAYDDEPPPKKTVSMAEFMASRNTPQADRKGSPAVSATASRAERRELEIKQRSMQEFTFQPRITELPKGYSASSTSPRTQEFHDRMSRWKDKKEQQLRRAEAQDVAQDDVLGADRPVEAAVEGGIDLAQAAQGGGQQQAGKGAVAWRQLGKVAVAGQRLVHRAGLVQHLAQKVEGGLAGVQSPHVEVWRAGLLRAAALLGVAHGARL